MATSGNITLQTELKVFERLRLSLFDRAPGKYALVKGSDLVDTYGSEAEAIREGYRRFGNEVFLVSASVEADVLMNFTAWNLGM
jgi:hypothetical protein